MSNKIMINIPLTKYLKEITKEWGETFVTKTYGGQVWISNEAPGELFKKEGLNYIEFNDSDMFIRLPKTTWEYIRLDKGCSKKLSTAIKDIQKLEKQLEG